MRRILVSTGADMHADHWSFGGGKAIQYLVVECNEAAQQAARGIELERQSALGKVNLHARRARFERAPDIRFSLVPQVGKKLLARVAFDSVSRIQKAQRRSRNN